MQNNFEKTQVNKSAIGATYIQYKTFWENTKQFEKTQNILRKCKTIWENKTFLENTKYFLENTKHFEKTQHN